VSQLMPKQLKMVNGQSRFVQLKLMSWAQIMMVG